MSTKNLTHKYSNNIADKKILIIGPYPPPLGGVSIHIKRVVEKLRKQNNTVNIHNTAQKHNSRFGSLKKLLASLFATKPNIIFYHEPTESIQKLFVTVIFKLFLRYELITIDHDCRLLYRFSKAKKRFLKRLLRRCNSCVVIGNTTYTCYDDNGIRRIKNLSVESPFLPPNTAKETIIFQSYPQSVHKFIERHSPLITANAFTPALHDGKDLYGFDLCIDLINSLRKTMPHVGMLFGICKVKTDEQKKYFATIKQEITKRGLDNHFYFFIDAPEFWVLIKHSNLFVRPTLSDSFGISVHEAIHSKTPVLASDVCIRPTGTILFKTGDKKDFLNKGNDILPT